MVIGVLVLTMQYSSAQTIVPVSKEFQTPYIELNESSVKGAEGEDQVNLPGENETTSQKNDTESEEQPKATTKATKPRKEVEGGLNLDTPGIQLPYKVKVSFDSITVHDSHEGSTRGDGEWKLAAYVQGKKIDLTEASCTHGTITATLPGGQHITLDQCGVTGLNDAGDGETIKFHPGTEVTVDIPSPLPLSIFVYGEEVDCDNPIFPDDVSKKVIAILKGPDTRENMLIEIQNWISFPFDNGIIDEYHHSVCFTGIITGDENTDLGVINKIYEPTGYGAGAHTNEVSTLGGHSGGSDRDYTLRYTISVAPPPPPQPPTIKPDTSSGTCNDNLPVSGVTSSGSQSTFPPINATDNNLNTKWWSTFIVKPFITLDSGGPKSVCSVDIAWADGSSHPYLFDVSVSTDGTTFTKVLSGTSTGTTTSPEKYTFPQTQARYVKITITQSMAGSASSIAQISEIDLFG